MNEQAIVEDSKVLTSNDVKLKNARQHINDDLPESPTGGNLTTGARDLSRLFYDPPTGRPDGIFQPLLCGVNTLLQEKGVPAGDLRSGLLIFMAINSSRLGYPLSLQLVPNNPLSAIGLLDHCVSLSPENASMEFQQLKPEHLFFNSGEHYKNKCIICPEPERLSKVNQEINLLLTRGHAIRQEFVNNKYNMGLAEHKAIWPISLIEVASEKSGKNLNHPALIKVPIASNIIGGLSLLPSVNNERFESVPILRNRFAFERLKHRPVEIPFAEQLLENFRSSGYDHIDIKMINLKKLISICTIMNQPEPVTNEELCASVYKTTIKNVRRWMKEGTAREGEITIQNSSSPIIATKIDYYIARLLLEGIMTTEDKYISARQKRIFETIKRVNMAKLNSAVLQKNDDIGKLSTIAGNYIYWVKREKIFEEINKDSGEYLSLSTINNELSELMQIGIVDRAKPPKSKHFGYFVMTLNWDEAMRFPHPSEINDPIYKGEPVEVINPLTGQTEKI